MSVKIQGWNSCLEIFGMNKDINKIDTSAELLHANIWLLVVRMSQGYKLYLLTDIQYTIFNHCKYKSFWAFTWFHFLHFSETVSTIFEFLELSNLIFFFNYSFNWFYLLFHFLSWFSSSLNQRIQQQQIISCHPLWTLSSWYLHFIPSFSSRRKEELKKYRERKFSSISHTAKEWWLFL